MRKIVPFVGVAFVIFFLNMITISYASWCIEKVEISEQKCGTDKLTIYLSDKELGPKYLIPDCIELDDLPDVRNYLSSAGNPLVDLARKCRSEKPNPPKGIVKIDRRVKKIKEEFKKGKRNRAYAGL